MDFVFNSFSNAIKYQSIVDNVSFIKAVGKDGWFNIKNPFPHNSNARRNLFFLSSL